MASDITPKNVVIAQIAKRRYGVQNVVVRIFDPDKAEFYEQRGLTIVCPTNRAIAEMIEAVERVPEAVGAAPAAAVAEEN